MLELKQREESMQIKEDIRFQWNRQISVKVGDKVVLKQRKRNTFTTKYELEPYTTRGYYRKESAALDPQANTKISNISEN